MFFYDLKVHFISVFSFTGLGSTDKSSTNPTAQPPQRPYSINCTNTGRKATVTKINHSIHLWSAEKHVNIRTEVLDL